MVNTYMAKNTLEGSNIQGFPYDYFSALHYVGKSFQINTAIDTISALRQTSVVIGEKKNLTQSDIEKIRRYYNCNSII